MEKEIFNAEDEKMLECLKTESAKKYEIIMYIIFFNFLRIITSLTSAFVITFLIFTAFWALCCSIKGFSLFISFTYLIIHFIYFEFYIKKEHAKSIKSYYSVTLEAIRILKIRLTSKLYN